jgi:DNA-nicking Smr family endonuclease
MNEIDLHGYLLEDALEEVHRLIARVRMSGHPQQVRIITGHGPIRESVKQLLTSYGIEHNIMIGNTGTIVAVVD